MKGTLKKFDRVMLGDTLKFTFDEIEYLLDEKDTFNLNLLAIDEKYEYPDIVLYPNFTFSIILENGEEIYDSRFLWRCV